MKLADPHPFFTVFTPVYNRRNTISRVWESLNNQTFKNFEWIVVDDGSSDNVVEILNDWKRLANFSVTILRQENKGKHVAWNNAIKIAKGELFVPADSDDSFTSDTLQFFYENWLDVLKIKKNKFSGINVLCASAIDKKIIGDKYPTDRFISNNLDLDFVHKIKGEKWGCIRTDLLKKRPFKEVKGSFLSENWIWYNLARQYKVICRNKVLRFYHTDDDNQVTKSISSKIKSIESTFTYISWNLETNCDYILKYDTLINKIKLFLNFWSYSFLLKKNVFSTLNIIKSKYLRFLLILFITPGFIVFLLTKRKFILK